MMHDVVVPSDWPFDHIPTWEHDEDGELEVSNMECRLCKFFGKNCKCINHNHVHFARPWFSCDVMRERHTICRAFEPAKEKAPAISLEWEALGGFDEWLRLWRKQWHPRHDGSVYAPNALLISAYPREGREFSDDVYIVSYDDFINCRIMGEDGIRCLNYRHIERSRNPKHVTGYKWVYEGPGLWVPWDGNKYVVE